MLTATFDEAETSSGSRGPTTSLLSLDMARFCLRRSLGGQLRCGAPFPFDQLSTSRTISFAHSSYVGDRAGWGRPFIRLGARDASSLDAEVMLSDGYFGNIKFTQEFSCFTEIFFAAQLNFLTASREVFDLLTEAQRRVLVTAGRETELALWKLNRDLVPRDHKDIAARGVVVAAQPSADLLAILRMAAEPDIQKPGRFHGRGWHHHPCRLPSRHRARVARCARSGRVGGQAQANPATAAALLSTYRLGSFGKRERDIPRSHTRDKQRVATLSIN